MGIFGMLSFSYGKPHFNRNLFHHRLTIQNYFTNIKLKLSKQLSTQKGFHFSVQLTKSDNNILKKNKHYCHKLKY